MKALENRSFNLLTESFFFPLCKNVHKGNDMAIFESFRRPVRLSIDHIGILGIEMELACSCGRISLKTASSHLHLKRLPALASIAS